MKKHDMGRNRKRKTKEGQMLFQAGLGSWALLCIALAAGYLVLSKALKENNAVMKYLGLVIGALILIVCLIAGFREAGRKARTRRPVSRRTQRALSGERMPSQIPDVQNLGVGNQMPETE